MSATSTPITPEVNARGRQLPRRNTRPPAINERSVRRRALTMVVLVLCGITVLLAVPGLRPVLREIAAMNPAIVAVAVALELASCLSFVIIFRLFFKPVPTVAAHELAWAQMGSGALLPGGGVGSLAVGGWLLHLAGMPTRQIVQRSSGLFFLTSSINVMTLAAAGLLLLLGIADGPHDVLRAGLPVIAAVGASALVLGLTRLTRRFAGGHPGMAWLDDVGAGIPAARDARHRGPRRRSHRRPRAVRTADHPRRRRRPRLPRDRFLDPHARGDSRLRPSEAPPGARRRARVPPG